MDQRIRVVLVDDHPMFRQAVALALAAEGDIEVVGQGGTATEAVELAGLLLPDVMILDLNMPGGGIEAALETRARIPEIRVVVLTVSDDESDMRNAMEAGVFGYILKGVSARDLKRTVREVFAGRLIGVVR